MDLSLVIPVYNEEGSLPELFEALEPVMKGLGKDYEYIFVDDGSVDGSLGVLRGLRGRSQRVKVISFRRNYGKSAALAVGFKEARGEVVVTMDADLQDDPAEIPNLLNKLDEGVDLVSGWKHNRQDPWTKTFPSRIFNFVTSLVSGLRLHDFNCGLKAYRGEVARSLSIYGELHRFIPVLAGWEGYRVDEIRVRHFKRKYGKSKYGRRIAIVLFLLGVAPQVYFLIEWLGGAGLRVRPIMLTGFVMIIVSLQIASIGLLAEMISARSGREPNYVFKEYLVNPSDQHAGGSARKT
jgi:glycosyltransferase involved in cell wall biosynthesis